MSAHRRIYDLSARAAWPSNHTVRVNLQRLHFRHIEQITPIRGFSGRQPPFVDKRVDPLPREAAPRDDLVCCEFFHDLILRQLHRRRAQFALIEVESAATLHPDAIIKSDLAWLFC